MHAPLSTPGPALAIAFALVSVGCGGEFTVRDKNDEGEANTPAIEVTPASLTFPPLTSRDFQTQLLTIENVGRSALSIDDLQFTELTPGGEGSYDVTYSADAPAVLPQGQTLEVEVTFQPVVGGDLPAELLILSDADNSPEKSVPISGIGQMPRLVVEPDPLDYGRAFIPCDQDKTVVIKNLGPEPAVLDDVYVAGDDADMLSIQTSIAKPLTLFENQQQIASIRLSPVRKARVSSDLALDGNDPRGIVEGAILAEAVYAAEVTDTFEIPDRFPVDLVFAIDQSGSMQALASQLRTQFENFVDDLEDATLDWRIGVVTHDRGTNQEGCFNGGSSGAITNVPGWESTLRSALFPGGVDDNDPLTEALLAAVELGLDRAVSGGCNAGFGQGRNPQQPPPLHVVVVSNERDQSEFEEIETMLGRSVSSDAATRAADFVAQYRSWAGNNAEVKVHGVIDVDFNPGTSNDCGGVRHGPAGYEDAILATNGFIVDVCASSNWSVAFTDIINDVIQGAQALKLSRTGVWEPSIRVTVDGTRADDGWYYDASRNAVVFDDPPRGSDVEVFYGVAADCD